MQPLSKCCLGKVEIISESEDPFESPVDELINALVEIAVDLTLKYSTYLRVPLLQYVYIAFSAI